MGCKDFCLKFIHGLLAILEVGIAIAIICIVAIQLSDVWEMITGSNNSCALSTPEHGDDLCIYAYVVCGISIGVSLVLSILLCCTCDLCGLGKFLDLLFAALACAWWIAAAVVFTRYVAQANDDNCSSPESACDDKSDWRNAVAILAWINVGLFAISGLISLIRICRCCCGCCFEDDKYKD